MVIVKSLKSGFLRKERMSEGGDIEMLPGFKVIFMGAIRHFRHH